MSIQLMTSFIIRRETKEVLHHNLTIHAFTGLGHSPLYIFVNSYACSKHVYVDDRSKYQDNNLIKQSQDIALDFV